jgi:hypothetical protein
MMLWGKSVRLDEYDLMKLPFKQVLAFHPGGVKYLDFKRTFHDEQGGLMAL